MAGLVRAARRVCRRALVRWHREMREFVLYGGWWWVLAWACLIGGVVMVVRLAADAGMY